jgi:hypothetical protein
VVINKKVSQNQYLIIWILIGVVIVDILRYVSWSGKLIIENGTYYSATIIFVSLYLLYNNFYKFRTPIDKNKIWYLKLWLGILLFSIIRSLFLVQSYWEWKFLLIQSVGFSLAPLFYFVGLDLYCVRSIYSFTFRWIFILGPLLIPLSLNTNIELYSRIMIPVTFFIIFIPYLPKRNILILICVALLSVFIVLDFRSLQLKIAIALITLLILTNKKFFGKKLLLVIHSFIFILPFIFLFAYFFFNYNLFLEGLSGKQRKEITVNVNNEESNLLADTRTFLYVEVIKSFNSTTEWVIGKGAAGTYQSSFFDSGGGDNKGKRFGSEVGILNILLRYGLIGCLIYFVSLFVLTRQALIYSSNYLVKMLSLLLSSRWPLSFLEEYTQYDLNFMFFWLFLGLISNNQFRAMNDMQLKLMFKF